LKVFGTTLALILSCRVSAKLMRKREVLANLQQINRGVRVIFASGYVDPRVKSELYKAGAKLFIQKPYVPAEVLRCIREVLDRVQA
jgi:FixJ family two-component response regulator